MTLGNRLYEMRKDKGLSQEKAAEVLGVTRQTISKWETDQSTPDFDKIVPLCTLYGISTEELLTGKKQDSTQDTVNSTVRDEYNYDDRFNMPNESPYEEPAKPEQEKENTAGRRKFAILTSISVCLYILSIIPLIIFDGSTASVAAFFVIIAIATMLVVFGALSKPKAQREDDKVLTSQKKLYKQITGILSGVTLCIYLFISFLTNDWHITWIIWVIYGIVCKIIDLILTLKESNRNEEN